MEEQEQVREAKLKRLRHAAKQGFDELDQGRGIVLNGKKAFNQFFKKIDAEVATSRNNAALSNANHNRSVRRTDIVNILTWTQENFGLQALTAYTRLIETVIEDIATEPGRAGSIQRPEIAENCKTYHLFHSRNRAAKRGQRIHRPRHLVLYRMLDEGTVEIGRVLHDSMDLDQNLPEEYRA